MGKGLWASSRDNEDDEAHQVVKNELVLSQALSQSIYVLVTVKPVVNVHDI